MATWGKAFSTGAKAVEVTQREKPSPKEEPDDDITEQPDSTAFENNNTIAPTNKKTPAPVGQEKVAHRPAGRVRGRQLQVDPRAHESPRQIPIVP